MIRFMVRLHELVDAMSFQMDDFFSFVERETGHIHQLPLKAFRVAEEAYESPTLLDDLSAEELADVQLASEIEGSDRFLKIPIRTSDEDWEVMRSFAEEVRTERMRAGLLHAIQGRGAFRVFRDRVIEYGLRDDWHAFRDASLRDEAIKFCREHGLVLE